MLSSSLRHLRAARGVAQEATRRSRSLGGTPGLRARHATRRASQGDDLCGGSDPVGRARTRGPILTARAPAPKNASPMLSAAFEPSANVLRLTFSRSLTTGDVD